MRKQFLFFLSLSCFSLTNLIAQKTKVDEPPQICVGLTREQKPIVAVMPFELAAPGAAPSVGSGLPDMLTNALFNAGCFRVVERARLNDVMREQGLGLSGAGDPNSFAKVGKLLGVNLLIMGTITIFNENESGEKAGGGGTSWSPFHKITSIVGSASATTSHVAYTIKFVDPNTGEILNIKEFDKKKTSVGLAGGGGAWGWGGSGSGGGSFYTHKSMQEALDESFKEAMTFMSQNREDYLNLTAGSKPQATNDQMPFNKDGCALLKSGHVPKIMVLIPEYHITQRYPDPAAETEINRKFLEAGFKVVDPTMFATIYNNFDFKDAQNDPTKAISYGKQFNADIVIYGEGVSERPGTVNNQNDAGTVGKMASVRARVEVRAVRTDDATIIASNGLEAGAVDNSEFVASKAALRKAGGTVADYLMQQFCSKNLSFGKGGGGTMAKSTPVTEIILLNADFSKVRALADMLGAKGKVLSHGITNGAGDIKLEHATGNDESIADYIDSHGNGVYNIQNIEAGKITLAIK